MEAIRLEGDTYQLLRNRLQHGGESLRERLNTLNAARREVFGALELNLLATERVQTPNHCISRDIVAIGNRCLLGYNVHIGLRSGIKLEDVFSVYHFQNQAFAEESLDLINDPAFHTDFQNLYKYYRNAHFSKFSIINNYLYMVFQVSANVKDIKAFKWLIRDDKLQYIDNRSEHEFRFPERYGFEWKRATRDVRREGKFPHLSIADKLFVETTGGDLTIKVEDNTDTGQGIYSEPVTHRDQTLDDAEFAFADLGNLVLLRVKPFQEENRYFLFNVKLQTIHRIDSIGESCQLLPDNQGIIYPDGYALQTGTVKRFDRSEQGVVFDRRIASPNGEDFLYLFYHEETGSYTLLPYNLIAQQVATPIPCHGYTLLPDGTLACFRAEPEPGRTHALQLWRSPFIAGTVLPSPKQDSFLYKVGNKDIVRAMADCSELLVLLNKEDTYGGLYMDLAKKAGSVLDSYHWISRDEAAKLHEPVETIREAAKAAVEEFEKVQQTRRETKSKQQALETRTREAVQQVKRQIFDEARQFAQAMASLRSIRGEIITGREWKYADLELLKALEAEVVQASDLLAGDTVVFLGGEKALLPYSAQAEAISVKISELKTALDGKKLAEEADNLGLELELLVEVITNLKIEDATLATRIVEQISTIFARLNQVKAALKQKLQTLRSAESSAEFAAQMRLVEQAMLSFLDTADTPDRCEELQNRLLVQVEEVEGRFAEYDEYLPQLAEQREKVIAAFEGRRRQLEESRNRRTSSILSAAERILAGVKNRARQFETAEDLNAYLAADIMVGKLRDQVAQLRKLGDDVKADGLENSLRALTQEALRQLADRKELFAEGKNVIKLGRHSFFVNTQPLDAVMVVRDGEMWYHLTGTGFYEPVTDPEILRLKSCWDMDSVAETEAVYRAEYLAYSLFINGKAALLAEKDLNTWVQTQAASRYAEGYVKGVHDGDAAKILHTLLHTDAAAGLLRFPPDVRARALVYWFAHFSEEQRTYFSARLSAAAALHKSFPDAPQQAFLIAALEAAFPTATADSALSTAPEPVEGRGEGAGGRGAANFLYTAFALDYGIGASEGAIRMATAAQTHASKSKKDHLLPLIQAEIAPMERFTLLTAWMEAFAAGHFPNDLPLATEAAALLMLPAEVKPQPLKTAMRHELTGLAGTHPTRLNEGKYLFDYHDFIKRLEKHCAEVAPAFSALQQCKLSLLEKFKQSVQLENMKPKPLSGFVRNKLIDSVYLPLIGDNLAKQIGTAGDTGRADRMGMLLLISPPGYGKTTLMEYIAERLGLIFIKINGPALGHSVTSLDPATAPNAAARQELEKLNLAFALGDNMMLMIDDIQHCNAEFLQKFISLTDGQRRVEGVYNGQARTYDLRGRKVCVVMAGNPYTEQGEQFRIPDMLANRSDIYNLGDIIGDSRDAFALSYIENALAANPALQRIAARNPRDVHAFLKLAETGSMEGITPEASHTPDEVSEYVAVLQKMIRVRDLLLKINLQYIASAAVGKAYRTEPPFLLQGSYRNMGKLAGKIVAVMNDAELETLLRSHYEGEAQTLTTGAEANLLKLKALAGWQTEAEQQRWSDICQTFREQNARNAEEPLGHIAEHLSAIRTWLEGRK